MKYFLIFVSSFLFLIALLVIANNTGTLRFLVDRFGS